MFFLPLSAILFIVFILLLPVLLILIQVGIIGAVSTKLGFPLSVGLLIYLFSLMGSTINIPVFKRKTSEINERDKLIEKLFGYPGKINQQIIAINVGGCIIPVLLSLYLFQFVSPLKILMGIGIMTAVSYFLARPVKGIGIAIPALIPPLFCVLITFIISPGNPAFAYVSGVIGTLIGADILHLKELIDINRSGVMSIGGAGVFDGIFLVGIISVLLA